MNKSDFDELVARFESPERESWQKPDRLLSKSGNIAGKTVVDLGAGSGYFTFRLVRRAAKVVALDYDPRFIEFLERRKAGLPNHLSEKIDVRLVEETEPRLEEKAAEVVLTVNTYHHFKNRIDYLKRIHFGLKKGGKLVIVDFKLGDLPFGPPEEIKVEPRIIQYELDQAGFAKSAVDHKLLPYQMLIEAFV